MSGKLAFLFSLLLSCVFLASPGTSYGQEVAKNSPIDRSNVEVSASLVMTPKFQIDGVSVEHSSKETRNNQKKWISVVVTFTTNKPDAKSTWGAWLDNIEAEIMFLCPGVDDKGRTTWTVFKGTQVLNPIAADGEKHSIRFFVPPYVVARYISLGKDIDKLDRLVSEIPIFVNLKYSNFAPAQGLQRCGKYFGDKLALEPAVKNIFNSKQLSNKDAAFKETARLFDFVVNNLRAFYSVDDAALPASKTPWAWVSYDKFDSDKDEQQRNRR